MKSNMTHTLNLEITALPPQTRVTCEIQDCNRQARWNITYQRPKQTGNKHDAKGTNLCNRHTYRITGTTAKQLQNENQTQPKKPKRKTIAAIRMMPTNSHTCHAHRCQAPAEWLVTLRGQTNPSHLRWYGTTCLCQEHYSEFTQQAQ